MYLGMLRAQPRDVVAKLNGMSAGEAHEVFEDLPVVGRDADGTPLYGVAQCRRKTVEVRNEPVATVKAATEKLLARQEEQFAPVRECVELFERESARYKQTSEVIEGRITAATKAVTNAIDEPVYLTVTDIARSTGWSVQTVRKHNRRGWFPRSLLPGSARKGQHAKFDPTRVWDDIEAIKRKP